MIILGAALKYESMGCSVLPIQANKKPYVAWEKYQKEKATPELIKTWWDKYPTANVAIVTGKLSKVSVVDTDSDEAKAKLDELLPDSFITPMAKTPHGGLHYYFQHENGLGNSVGFMDKTDFRGEGGYIIAPPSKGYSWLPNLSIDEIDPAFLPLFLKKALETSSKDQAAHAIKDLSFSKGTRDEDLFHSALNLFKGGASLEEVQKTVLNLAKACTPPFPPEEALAKVGSAFERTRKKERNLTQEIRGWIGITEGEFQTREVFEELNISREDKAKVSVILTRLVLEGLIERTGKRTGCFRRVVKEMVKMDIFSTLGEIVDIRLPLGLDKLVKTRKGEVIVIAGAKNSGKTALSLWTAMANRDNFKVTYFNSEMGEDELKERCENFKDIPFEEWRKVDFYPRSESFQDVIVPGEGNLNIIDFLEVYEDFWIIKKWIARIWKKLDGAIAIINIQKPQGRDFGWGGEGTIEKARLALAVDKGTLKIVAAKSWKGRENPNGKGITFKVVNGSEFIQTDQWSLPEKEC